MIGRDAPVAACQLPSVRRRSGIRRSRNPAPGFSLSKSAAVFLGFAFSQSFRWISAARSKIRFQALFGSTKWPVEPFPGNTHVLADDALRFSSTLIAGTERATVTDSP